jgi:hypothetical protein
VPIEDEVPDVGVTVQYNVGRAELQPVKSVLDYIGSL